MFKLVRSEDHFITIMNTLVGWREMVEKYGVSINNLVSDLTLIKEHKEHYQENSDKCKEYIRIVHSLFKLGKDSDSPPIFLYQLIRRGYWAAAIMFNLTEHQRQRMYFGKEVVNFAKTAAKFSTVLGKEVVRPEIWKMRQTNA